MLGKVPDLLIFQWVDKELQHRCFGPRLANFPQLSVYLSQEFLADWRVRCWHGESLLWTLLWAPLLIPFLDIFVWVQVDFWNLQFCTLVYERFVEGCRLGRMTSLVLFVLWGKGASQQRSWQDLCLCCCLATVSRESKWSFHSHPEISIHIFGTHLGAFAWIQNQSTVHHCVITFHSCYSHSGIGFLEGSIYN